VQSAARWLLLVSLAIGCADGEPGRDPRDVRVRVGTIGFDANHSPVVVLEEQDGERMLPIWIGAAEAGSIAAELHRRPPPRPNFHDFAKRVIQSVDAEVVQVVVTEIRDGTYYATLSLRANGKLIEIDARPSDAIAMALRMDAPILVRETLFDDAGDALPDGGDGQAIRWQPAPGAQPGRSAQASRALKL
jgi:bifunctional DNase/RNase